VQLARKLDAAVSPGKVFCRLSERAKEYAGARKVFGDKDSYEALYK
jgi:hypothetical protein